MKANIVRLLSENAELKRERDEARTDLEFRRGLYKVQEQYLETARRERDEAREERDQLKQLLAADAERVDAYLGACIERDEAREAYEVERLIRERDEALEALDCLLAVIGLTPALQAAVDQGLAVLRKWEETK